MTLASVAGAIMLATLPIAAQQYVLNTPRPPAALDFTAFDAEGRPVTDLTPADLTVRIDGRTRQLQSLQWVGADTSRLPAPYGTNLRTSDSRAVLLIIEDESLKPGREQAIKADVRTFLRALGANDRVAVLTLPYGGMKSDFTSDHSRVLEAVDSITGRAAQSESAGDAGCRTRSTLVALAGTLDSIVATDAPLSVVLFTGGLMPPRGMVTMSSTPTDIPGVSYFNTIGTCEVLPDHYQAIAESTARSRAQWFVIQPDLTSDAIGRPGLEHLTGLTGGPLWNLDGDQGGALARVAAQTAGFYRATLIPEPNESAEVVRGLAVSALRPGITIRHRPRIQLLSSVEGTPQSSSSLMDLMRTIKEVRDLHLRVAATTARHADGQVKLLVQFEAPDVAEVVAPMVSLFDATGRMVVSNTAKPEELSGRNSGILAVTAPEGRYRMRLAAAAPSPDNSLRMGTVDLDVEVGLTTVGPLRLSGLVLGQARPEGFTPKLEFQSEVSAVAMVEIYGGQAGAQVGVAVEVVRPSDGAPLATMPGIFTPTSEPDKFLVTATIPVGALPPGDYLVRVLVKAGDTVGQVTRTLRKLTPR